MVGRIIVGKPSDAPGIRSFGYAPDKKWKPVPEVAQKQFSSIEGIMEKGKVRSSLAKSTAKQLDRTFLKRKNAFHQ